MEPLTALSLASSIIQIVDFTGKIISRSKEIYRSADGVLETVTVLEQAANQLQEMSADLKAGPPDLSEEEMKYQKPMSASERQLLQLSQEAKDISEEIVQAVNKIKVKGSKKAWKSVEQALRSVWSQKEMSALETRLDTLRKQIDTALLFSLRSIFRPDFEEPADEYDLGQSQTDFLRELTHSNRLPAATDDPVQFAAQVQSMAQKDFAERFHKIISARLRFAEFPDRLESIPKAHQDTFTWIFTPPETHAESASWESFTKWLRGNEGQNLYWIAGKPGSGKSTLMKFLYQDGRTCDQLKSWSEPTPLVFSGCFFWNSGTVMQMSRLGLLRSLLYQSLQQMVKLDDGYKAAQELFPERWEEFEAFGGGRQSFAWPELRRAFESLVSNTSKCFFFAIDGLDEYDGNPKELIDLILTVSKRENVKICTASRPWPVFEGAFEDRPGLLLEDLTRNDIQAYVSFQFEANKHYIRLCERDPEQSKALVQDVISKADGVFLWVYLVVESLLQGLTNADRMPDLQNRLNGLPGDLEGLFAKLLNRLDPNYFRHACQLFRLLDAHPYPSLVCFGYADDDDHQSSISAEIRSLPAPELAAHAEEMARRLKSRCLGLLEIFPEEVKVRYLHRTAKDFLKSERIWKMILDTTGTDSFDVNARWANGYLWTLKTMTPKSDSFSLNPYLYGWEPLTWCIEYALRMEHADGKVRLTYFDEVGRAALQKHHEAVTKELPPDVFAGRVKNFLDLATLFGLEGYVRVKAKHMSKAELTHALRFAQSCSPNVGKRLPGRDALKDQFGAVSVVKVLRSRSDSHSSLQAFLGLRAKVRAPQFV
ncbi:hypothetical protein BCR34DRAFT_479383 [Clohesyomyces aquaticus]|uniref:Uncharacterized protein n=1 Tax=Clohesyomyces aquaticus TaxID=1231657 RepID=A0A1Y1ZWI7_9PLEO|nr:hypothetical protein BCR34DRAFT_479383 [Clohesyomyces aquaticus]